MGGPQGPSVSRSPEVSPQKKAGRPMGPSTPRCSPQIFLFFVLSRMSRNKFSDWFFVLVCALGKLVCNFEPFKFRAFSRFFVWEPPLELSGCFWDITIFLFLFGERCLLFFLPSLRDTDQDSHTHTHTHTRTHTHTHTGGTPFPSCSASPVAAFCCFFLLCGCVHLPLFCCHLVFVSDSRGSVKYPRISGFLGITCFFWGPFPI